MQLGIVTVHISVHHQRPNRSLIPWTNPAKENLEICSMDSQLLRHGEVRFSKASNNTKINKDGQRRCYQGLCCGSDINGNKIDPLFPDAFENLPSASVTVHMHDLH